MKKEEKHRLRKPQHQNRPGREYKMRPVPLTDDQSIKGSGKLRGKVALITGGDSGIGKAIAILFAKEGADVAIVYLEEEEDARDTWQHVEAYGQRCLMISGDVSRERFCASAVEKTIKVFGRIDVLVNNTGTQYQQKSLEDVTTAQWQKTFYTNIFSFFWFTKNALPYMKKGSTIVNTASVTAYRGSPQLLDYSATKGAIVSFTRSLAVNLLKKGIRVNAVAPGPVWTPLIVSSFNPEKVASFGSDTPMKRAGEPAEIANCFLFLACNDSSYMTGQVLHPNGGEIING